MSDEAHITIRRGKSYADYFRAYRIEVDGVIVGSVRAGQSVTIPVSTGSHAIRLRIDWCGSEKNQFDAQRGDRMTFNYGSSLEGWRLLLGCYYALFRTQQCLWLHKAR